MPFDNIDLLFGVLFQVVKCRAETGILTPDILEVMPFMVMNGAERLESGDHMIAYLFLVSGDQVPDVAAIHVRITLHSEQSQESRHEIQMAGQGIYPPAPESGVRITDNQGHAGHTGIEQFGLFLDASLLSQVGAVIGTEHDDRVVPKVQALDFLDKSTDTVVGKSDLG